jgi:transcriptional regulator with XRE-family HTH domain
MNSFCAEHFGKNLKEAREERGQSMRELSIDLELDAGLVCRYESGKRYPAFPTFCRICAVLEKNPNEMLEGNKYF